MWFSTSNLCISSSLSKRRTRQFWELEKFKKDELLGMHAGKWPIAVVDASSRGSMTMDILARMESGINNNRAELEKYVNNVVIISPNLSGFIKKCRK